MKFCEIRSNQSSMKDSVKIFSKCFILFMVYSLIFFGIHLSHGLAQQKVKTVNLNKINHMGTYRYSDGVLIPTEKSDLQQDVIFDNTNSTGGFFPAEQPTERIQDWGTSPGGLVKSFQIGYATTTIDSVDINIFFYSGTTDSDTGEVIASFPLTLLGSTPGETAAFTVVIELTEQGQFALPDTFGYAYNASDTATGPIMATGGTGITDAFRLLPDESLFWFNGDPFAQFWMQLSGDLAVSVDEKPTSTTVPKAFTLEQNYPNPFNPSTKIRYAIPENSRVTLKVFNLLGRPVGTLVDEHQGANNYEITWDGRDDAGVIQSSGVYILQLKSGNNLQSRKMVFIK